MNRDDQPGIGILDSGVGGLTVVKEVLRQLRGERIIYFGDTSRCPYGPRPKDEVIRFTLEIVRFLERFPLKALVIACNTATAVAIDEVRRRTPIPVLGVIEPGARAAIQSTRKGRIGVIGTQGTVRSGAYERALKRMNPRLFVVSHACPALVPLVESDLGRTEEARRVVASSLAPLQVHRVDTLILGCTHYPLIADLIGEVMGKDVQLISSAEETARELKILLQRKKLLSPEDEGRPLFHRFFTSGDPDFFRRIAERWLGCSVHVSRAMAETSVPSTL
ncbi:glutamate racemase [Planifilum fulgidum]|uniref:Glutamate racemase n=1 Tax=Planifilum fulgidum TaxID=201973 RepID=A0A1I2MFS6_9BACL|nr:glutamate racemase [Planifilum fulgidum]MBO2495264.1 glutamate racemase [Bacillota bacterium]MBO2533854.1 glutamate racemase [Thermoactinomycetaceae bacterium]SFF90313.1 glutamate racemase [Planifilum fulgidum]